MGFEDRLGEDFFRFESQEDADRDRMESAAPDLLEALESLVDAQNGPPLLGRHEEDWKKAMDAARAAIKKARGERHGKDMATIG